MLGSVEEVCSDLEHGNVLGLLTVGRRPTILHTTVDPIAADGSGTDRERRA